MKSKGLPISLSLSLCLGLKILRRSLEEDFSILQDLLDVIDE